MIRFFHHIFLSQEMKSAFVFALIFACSIAAFVPSMAMKSMTSTFTNLSKATPAKQTVKEEDVKFCGSYSTGCIASPFVAMQADMKILGMMHKNPIYIQFPVNMYMGQECTEQGALMEMTMNAPMKAKNGIEKTMVVTPEKFTVTYKNEAALQGMTCTTPLELNVEYDITTLDCKDDEGNDPFADNKAMIGVDMDTPFNFGENEITIKTDDEEMTLKRLGDEGCTCAKGGLRM